MPIKKVTAVKKTKKKNHFWMLNCMQNILFIEKSIPSKMLLTFDIIIGVFVLKPLGNK
jgi:hypothetical protein